MANPLKLAYRNYEPGDEKKIVALYNQITGFNRTTEQHSWEWLQNPNGKSEIFILEEHSTKELLGHHGLIPLKLHFNGKSLLAGKTENTILNKKLQGTGVYFLHERRFLKIANERFSLLFTTSGHSTWGRIRKRLGYKSLAPYARFVKVCNPQNFPFLLEYYFQKRNLSGLQKIIRKIALNLILYLTYFFQYRINPEKNQYIIKPVDEANIDFDELWKNVSKNLGTTIERSSHYLRWRIFDNPNVDYKVFMAWEQRSIVGSIIIQIDTNGIPTGKIVDIVAKNNLTSIHHSLVEVAETYFKEKGISYIFFPTLKNDSPLYKSFVKMGFMDISNFKKEESTFLLYLGSEVKNNLELTNSNNWYYTDLFSEGFL